MSMMHRELWRRFIRKDLRSDDSGQAIIETALILPVMLLLMLGAFDAGRAAYVAIELESAARAAAAYGSRNAITAADTAGMQAVAEEDAPELNLTASNVAITDNTCACVVSGTAGAASTGACTATCGGYIVNYLNIQTSQSYTPLFSAVLTYTIMPTFTLKGNAIQEVLE